MNFIKTINIERYQNIVILTGAGVSAASGIRSYRGDKGLWTEFDPQEHADRSVLERDPWKIWQFFGPMRSIMKDAKPNPAHITLAELESSLDNAQSWTLITQNVDELHTRAGSENVIALHGSLLQTRCIDPDCHLEPFNDYIVYTQMPLCPVCGSPLRPNIVLFNEPLPPKASWKAKRALRDCDLFLSIGTSGAVAPACHFARSADYVGARTVSINTEAMFPSNPYFQEQIIGPAEDIIQKILVGRS
tara:strand:+ start:3004 stop:3744 length:741 start_codon:yes stop_codon:yes gene_type:complete